MARVTDIGPTDAPQVQSAAAVGVRDAFYQAYQILHVAFIVVPIIAGLDKFFHALVDWHVYLSPTFAQLSPFGPHPLMYVVGVIEIAAGLLVAFRPRIGGYIVTLWLWAIIANLFLLGDHYDIALRDFGLSLGALALARLAVRFDLRTAPAR